MAKLHKLKKPQEIDCIVRSPEEGKGKQGLELFAEVNHLKEGYVMHVASGKRET